MVNFQFYQIKIVRNMLHEMWSELSCSILSKTKCLVSDARSTNVVMTSMSPKTTFLRNYHKTKVVVIISKADFSSVKTYWIYQVPSPKSKK